VPASPHVFAFFRPCSLTGLPQLLALPHMLGPAHRGSPCTSSGPLVSIVPSPQVPVISLSLGCAIVLCLARWLDLPSIGLVLRRLLATSRGSISFFLLLYMCFPGHIPPIIVACPYHLSSATSCIAFGVHQPRLGAVIFASPQSLQRHLLGQHHRSRSPWLSTVLSLSLGVPLFWHLPSGFSFMFFCLHCCHDVARWSCPVSCLFSFLAGSFSVHD